MKKCEKCQKIYEKGNFCKACGGKLLDLSADEGQGISDHEINEKNQEESESNPQVTENQNQDSDKVEDEPLAKEEVIETKTDPDENSSLSEKTSDTILNEEEFLVQEELRSIEDTEEATKTEEEESQASDELEGKKIKNKKTKNKSKKEKKKSRWFRLLLMIILFLFIGLLVFAGYYMNQSQIDLMDTDDFDPVTFERNLLEDDFDGQTFSFVSDQEAIAFYLDRWFNEKEGKSPFNLEITGLGYDPDRDLILINLDKNLIHTTLGLRVSMLQDGDLLKFKVKKAYLGKWHLPISKDYVLSTFDLPLIFEEGVIMPEFLSLSEYSVEKNGVEIEAVLDLEYFKVMFLDSFDNLADYYDYGISYNEEGQRMDGFYSMRDFWQKEEAKLFLKNISTNETFLVTYLSLLQPEYARGMVEKFVADGLYIRQESIDRVVNAYTNQSKAIQEEYTNYTENAQRKAYLTLAMDLSRAYYEAYENENKEDIISIKGRPFYLTWSIFLDDDFRGIYNSEFDYDIFYLDGFTLFGLDTPHGYLVYEDETTYEWYDMAEEFYGQHDYDKDFSYETGQWLRTGDLERKALEDAIAYYEGYENGAWINFMTASSDSAYVLAAEKGNSQILQQYTLTKSNDEWSVHNVYGTDVSNLQMALEYRDIYSTIDYNISLLPYFDITDYYIWYYTPEEIKVIVDYLVDNAYISGDLSANYFRRIDDFAYIGFDDGTQFVFEFEPDSTDNYVNLMTIDKNDTIENYYYDVFGESNYDFWPVFLWIQP